MRTNFSFYTTLAKNAALFVYLLRRKVNRFQLSGLYEHQTESQIMLSFTYSESPDIQLSNGVRQPCIVSKFDGTRAKNVRWPSFSNRQILKMTVFNSACKWYLLSKKMFQMSLEVDYGSQQGSGRSLAKISWPPRLQLTPISHRSTLKYRVDQWNLSCFIYSYGLKR